MKTLCLSVLLMALLSFASMLYAQDELTESFTTSDGTFRFRYPSSWTVRERPDGIVIVEGDETGMTIIPPSVLLGSPMLQEFQSAEDIARGFFEATSDQYDAEDFTEIVFDNGLKGVRANFTSSIPSFKDATAAFVLSLETEDSFVTVMASSEGSNFEELEPIAFAVVESFEFGVFELPGEVSGTLPTLEHYMSDGMSEGEWRDAIDELRAADLIPDDGDIIYSESVLFGGGLVMDENLTTDYPDVVMAGLISFRPVEDTEAFVCGLLSRVESSPSGDFTSFLMVGITPQDTILVVEGVQGEDEPRFHEIESPVAFHNPHHILYIARADRLTVFLDGEAIIEDWRLASAPDSEDLEYDTGVNLDRGCVMTGVWTYGLPAAE